MLGKALLPAGALGVMLCDSVMAKLWRTSQALRLEAGLNSSHVSLSKGGARSCRKRGGVSCQK